MGFHLYAFISFMNKNPNDDFDNFHLFTDVLLTWLYLCITKFSWSCVRSFNCRKLSVCFALWCTENWHVWIILWYKMHGTTKQYLFCFVFPSKTNVSGPFLQLMRFFFLWDDMKRHSASPEMFQGSQNIESKELFHLHYIIFAD